MEDKFDVGAGFPWEVNTIWEMNVEFGSMAAKANVEICIGASNSLA